MRGAREREPLAKKRIATRRILERRILRALGGEPGVQPTSTAARERYGLRAPRTPGPRRAPAAARRGVPVRPGPDRPGPPTRRRGAVPRRRVPRRGTPPHTPRAARESAARATRTRRAPASVGSARRSTWSGWSASAGSDNVVRRAHSAGNASTPRIRAITSMRSPRTSSRPHRKCTACPRSRYRASKGGTAVTAASNSSRALESRERFSLSATIARSTSRLNSAAPYRMHA